MPPKGNAFQCFSLGHVSFSFGIHGDKTAEVHFFSLASEFRLVNNKETAQIFPAILLFWMHCINLEACWEFDAPFLVGNWLISYLFMFYFELDVITSSAGAHLPAPWLKLLLTWLLQEKREVNANTGVKVNFPSNDSAGDNDDSCQVIVHDSELEHEKLMIRPQQN